MKYRTTQVFVPGGMPEHTYNPRTARKLEERLSSANDNLCKLITVTGMTKSGKTVLVNRIFPKAQCVWVDGGTVGSEDDFWGYILDKIRGYTETGSRHGKESTYGVEAGIEADGSIPFLAKMLGKIGSSYSRKKISSQSINLSIPPRTAAISQLRKCRKPLVIDDFHFIDRTFQGDIIRALKPLVFEGIPIVLIAIPHRRYDAVKVEREMTGRLETIDVPAWDADELSMISRKGFHLLNVNVNGRINLRLVKEALGSPHLMQEFCRTLANEYGVTETVNNMNINNMSESLFYEVAEHTDKIIFDKLAKGPRQRSDRIQRHLKNGDTADIYKVILLALANLQPGLSTVNYEQLRTSIREILADDIPQSQEVSRVLEKMSHIASNDEASTPVLEWEKEDQQLHINDPFFAFYLKWGINVE